VFSARAWLADLLGCYPIELDLVGSPALSLDGLEQGDYQRGDVIAGTVVVTGVHERFGEPPYRIVMVTMPSGQRSKHIPAEEEVAW
jgi:hypothetical protein